MPAIADIFRTFAPEYLERFPNLPDQHKKVINAIVNCRSGSQSAMACNLLRKEGFEEVFNLRGGILAWQSANLPITRKRR